MKRGALRVSVQATGLWLPVVTAACALAPTHARQVVAAPTLGPGSYRASEEVPSAPLGGTAAPPEEPVPHDSAAAEVILPGDPGRVPRVPHLTQLVVPGHPDAIVAEPFAAEGPRPVVVVLHGLGDRPEPHCEAWRTITAAEAFVLCPRGAFDPERSTPWSPRYTHPGGAALRAHVDAALAALAGRYGTLADTSQPLLAGFSLGATEAALLAQADPARFPRVAVIEGGLDVWIGPTIRVFASQGGQRVLFGCGSPWCPPPARADVARIERAGPGARMAFADVGHRPAPALQKAIRSEFAWFVAGDERWRVE